ncbi:helicase-associated domain-containing protein [Streptomyces sp. NPDC052236]|uniref:helicase-associated domain-containing protein n=1 Tax=Streptomyces sp. NPDC052236 TaxID=3365686 RepID=UPI0037D5274C
MIPISGSRSSALTRWLRTLDADRLRRILETRPDAVRAPEPATLGELADRLQRPGSVALVIPRLPLPCLQAAEALAALRPPVHPARLEQLLEADGAAVEVALSMLAEHALAWPGASGELHMAAALREAWQTPLGLGPGLEELLAAKTSEELRQIASALGLPPVTRKQDRLQAVLKHHGDPGLLGKLIASAPPRARELLEQHTGEEPPVLLMSGAPAPDSARRWLLDRALLVGHEWAYQPARVPAEVTRALRGPGWHAPFTPGPPEPKLVRLMAAEVDREAAAAATAFAGQAAALLAECAAHPPAALKSGGIGTRELARMGKAVQCEEPVVRMVLESAYAAGLLAYEGRALLVTAAYDAWAGQEPADQYPVLLQAWWELGCTPSGSRDDENKAVPAVGRTPPCAGCLAARQGLLTALADLPEGYGVRDPADLGDRIAWQRPFADELPQDATPFAGLIREAELLGVLGRGALSSLGAALTSDDPAMLRDRAAGLLPTATGTVRLGADLTAVVTGQPTAGLAALLDALADRETRSAASVWRFSTASLRRALDAGRTADGMRTDLSAVTDGPLPQPLGYLITDAARRHGQVRVAPAACVLHSDDTALLGEITAHRALSALGLRRLAPTVLLCRLPLPETLDALRAAGYAPAAETDDGTVRLERPERPRATPRPLPRPRRTATRPQRRPPELAVRLLAAPDRAPHPDPEQGIPFQTDTEEILAGWAKALTLTDIRQLAHAIHEKEPLTIEYVASSGNHTIRTLSALRFDPPLLYAYCHLREDERVFSLSRIHAVMPA